MCSWPSHPYKSFDLLTIIINFNVNQEILDQKTGKQDKKSNASFLYLIAFNTWCHRQLRPQKVMRFNTFLGFLLLLKNTDCSQIEHTVSPWFWLKTMMLKFLLGPQRCDAAGEARCLDLLHRLLEAAEQEPGWLVMPINY